MLNENTTPKTDAKTDFERKPLPNKAFDMEYQTERWREVQFLAERGIQYTFVRKTRDYGVSQYKYKKTPALFAALVEFYSIIEAEKALKVKPNKDYTKKPAVSQAQIERAKKILETAAECGLLEQAEQKEHKEDDTE